MKGVCFLLYLKLKNWKLVLEHVYRFKAFIQSGKSFKKAQTYLVEENFDDSASDQSKKLIFI